MKLLDNLIEQVESAEFQQRLKILKLMELAYIIDLYDSPLKKLKTYQKLINYYKQFNYYNVLQYIYNIIYNKGLLIKLAEITYITIKIDNKIYNIAIEVDFDYEPLFLRYYMFEKSFNTFGIATTEYLNNIQDIFNKNDDFDKLIDIKFNIYYSSTKATKNLVTTYKQPNPKDMFDKIIIYLFKKRNNNPLKNSIVEYLKKVNKIYNKINTIPITKEILEINDILSL